MPMLLKGENGNEFELGLIENRLPELQDGYGDNATVTLTFRVATEAESWEETAPIINHFELKNLLEWLEAVAAGGEEGGIAPEAPELELLQPELRFLLVKDAGDKVTLRIGFHLEDRPRELNVDAETDEAAHVDLRLTREALGVAVERLREDLDAIDKPAKDDLTGDDDLGEIGVPDEDLAMIDREDEDVPFPGTEQDNAGRG